MRRGHDREDGKTQISIQLAVGEKWNAICTLEIGHCLQLVRLFYANNDIETALAQVCRLCKDTAGKTYFA